MSDEWYDWEKARKIYEEEGKSLQKVADIIGSTRQTVSRHAEAEGWVSARVLAREALPARRENVLRLFIERDSEAICRSLEQKHEINQILLRVAKAHAERLESGTKMLIKSGTDRNGDPVYVEEDPILSLSRLAVSVKSIEAVDRSIAGIRDDSWRAKRSSPASAAKPDVAEVRKRLRESMPAPQDSVN